MSFNRLIVIGKLGRNPQLKFTHSGDPICYLALLSKETVKNKVLTTWYQVILLGSQAEQAEKNLAKGNNVYVEGRLRPQEIKDKEGKPHTVLEVFATSFRILDSLRTL